MAVLAFMIAPLASGAPQSDPDDPGTNLPPTTLTSVGEFWSYRHYKPQERQQVRLEFVVTYYDPPWNMLWGTEGADGAFFLPTATGQTLPLQAGQRVRITGSVVPAMGLEAAEVKVTVLAGNAWPTPTPTDGRLSQAAQLDARFVTVEGVVCGQIETDGRHIKYLVLAEGWLINARVLFHAGAPVPQLGTSRVRIRGVYIGTKDPSGVLQRIDLWIADPNAIEVLGSLADDPRFERPRTLIGGLAQAATEWVRVAGAVVRHEPGQQLIVRDETGQLHVRTPQPGKLAAGDPIELIGRRSGSGLEWTLRDAVFRPAPRAGAPGALLDLTAPTKKLRLAAQVLELRPDEAAQHMSAEITGIVTWADPQAPFFFIHDTSGGVRVRVAAGAAPPALGASVRVSGTTETGAFAPELTQIECAGVGEFSMPTPRTVTLEQAMTGAEEARWVELRGYLRQVSTAGPWQRLDFTTATGEFAAFAAPHPEFAALCGAVVRVAGVCAAESNARHELTGVRLWIADPSSITVEAPPAADPFAAPTRTIESLRQFAARDAIDRRVRVVATVTRHVPGRALFVQDGDAGLLVLSRETTPADPGDRIEVVGFPGRDGSRIVLRAASWRRVAPTGNVPQPLDLDPSLSPQSEFDARLVRVRGTLTEIALRSDETRFILREKGRFFEAQLPSLAPTVARVGAVVDLTGIYSMQYDEARRPRRFTMLLRAPGDIVLISAPPWWTATRITIAGAVLLFLALAAASWVVVLRRRVARQTEQIRAQMANEARLQGELERSSRLESVGVLAGGIAHDFNNLLTAIVGNLGLIALDDDAMRSTGHQIREAQRAAKRASDITQQLLTFAKGGDPVRKAVILSEVVEEATEFALHGAKVRSEFSCPSDLPAADVDAGQISRVVHNLVLNAAQAMPDGGIVRLALVAEEIAAGDATGLAPGRYVRLTVADNGLGISEENLARIFEPYFSTKGRNSGLGLATVHSIVKKHQGHITVESHLGRGTTFHVWLPAARNLPAPPTETPPPAPERRSVRVLLMDDEEIIRNVAAAFLKRFGHEATLVADGADAVRTYAEAKNQGHPFDVVILDLTVPGGMGGRDALVQLRTIDPNVRAVASSGYSSDPVLANYRAHGFRAIMPKPYDLKTFATMLEDMRRL